ncbi:hypothetical protein CSC94_12775 [Zhengella mangrovi]|uniref:Uncharacterized protein n=1 Tax=Zhengella mangrovi TaxID=1982044 RepID=A0A2G1QLZ9_9HYPH|nr:hypothetical protein [Zhengella mangrovi]PHP66557.1 hypothetical protein CSC94_12775 [Zhengella mangrovi]
MTFFAPSIDPSTNDLHLAADGNLAMVTGADAVGQHGRQRINTFEGEWFLDTTAGLPWLSDILGQAYDPELAEAIVKAEILDTAGVTGLSAFSISFNKTTRGVLIKDIDVLTTEGEVTL